MPDKTPEQSSSADPSEVVDADIRASIAALRADIWRLGGDLKRLERKQCAAAHASLRDVEAELKRRMRQNPLSAALTLTLFGYALGRLSSLRRRR
jgi:hypothetical protein